MGLLPLADADFHLYCLPLSQKGLIYAECVCMRMSNIDKYRYIYLYDMLHILIGSEATFNVPLMFLSPLTSLHLIHLANQDSLLQHKPLNCVLRELISFCFPYSGKYKISLFVHLLHCEEKCLGNFFY